MAKTTRLKPRKPLVTSGDEDEAPRPAKKAGKSPLPDPDAYFAPDPDTQAGQVVGGDWEDQDEDEEEDEEAAPEDAEPDTPVVLARKNKKGEPVSTAVRAVIDLDRDRPGPKLTKKEKAKQAEWHGKNRGKKIDSFFARQVAEGRKKFGGDSVMIGDETKNLVIGIPCPSLAFEYVIAQDCFPLGLILQLVAKHGTGKSALLAEFGRWFDAVGGGMNLFENETKFNAFWYESLMGTEVFRSRVPLYRCKSVEDWQRKLTFAMTSDKKRMMGTKEDPGPGRTFPILYGIDSIMGKMSEENQEKILGSVGKKGERGKTGEGFAQARSFPIEAGSITKYLRTIPQEMDRWPFALVLINHLRVKNDDMGNLERNKTGGVQVDFQESFELELAKVGGHKKTIECADFSGIPLSISCEKNSFGPTHRKIQTRLIWWEVEDETTGGFVQKTVWDWDWSTIHLLNFLLRGDKASPRLKQALKDIDFHLECPKTSDIENEAWSKSLGMKEKDAMPWTEVGAMIRENKELTGRLRKALRINSRPLLKGDYLEQMSGMVEELP